MDKVDKKNDKCEQGMLKEYRILTDEIEEVCKTNPTFSYMDVSLQVLLSNVAALKYLLKEHRIMAK